MSRPARPHPAINRKEWVESHLISRRNREDAVRSTWKTAAKYFQAWDVKAKKYAELSSPESYQTSMNAYIEKKRLDDQEKMLNVRRNKLTHLFHEENEKYQTELKALLDRRYQKTPTPIPLLANPETSRPITPMSAIHIDGHSPDITAQDHDAEEETASVVQPATMDHGASTSSSDRSRRSKQLALPTAVQREALITSRAEAPPSVHRESAAITTTPTFGKHGSSSTLSAKVIPDSRCENVKRTTRHQTADLVENLKWTEREASALKQEYAALQHALSELQHLSQHRLQLDKQQVHSELFNQGNKLKRPYKVQIQTQSHIVQHLMEFDLRFIERMLAILRLVDHKDSSLLDDLGQIHLRIMQNLKVEQHELLQSECLFHEEAERMWRHKVNEWEQERKSRAALIEKTWRLIESKAQARLAANLEQQQGNITSRENMLCDLDAGNSMLLKKSSPPDSAAFRECAENECVAAIDRLKL